MHTPQLLFLTTHYMEEAAAADRIIILDHGKIIASGTPFDLKERYAKDKLRLFCAQEIPGLPQGSTPTAFGYEIPLERTLDALPILSAVQDKVEGFEVIQGDMDDVFLNAVGTKLED